MLNQRVDALFRLSLVVPSETIWIHSTVRFILFYLSQKVSPGGADNTSEYSDDDLLDALFRVQLVSPSQYNSRRSTRVSTRATSPAESDTEDHSQLETASVSMPPVEVFTEVSEHTMEPRVNINLGTQVAAGGLNFSQGQRQVCLLFATPL